EQGHAFYALTPMHQHSHAHETTSTSVSRKLVIASIATLILVGGELVAGRIAGSLSLVGDALHNFTDVLALVIALAAVRISKRPATETKTFGYQRAGILAAFINAGSLLAFTAFIVAEAIHPWRHPAAIDTKTMMIVAAVALVLNLGITISLHKEGREDVNIRSAVLHMFGDA